MKDEKFNWKLSLCISLFSFSSYVTQPLYSAFVPSLLAERLSNTAQVGLILSFCNLLTMILHPAVGAISDRTRCRFGRRRPYILSGAVFAGISFMLIPWLNTFWQFVAVLICYSLTLAYWKAPIGAIQVDCVKPEYITRSNAVASCVLALSSVIAYLAGNRLTASGLDERDVFLFGGVAMIITAGIGCMTVHEQDSRNMNFPKKHKKRSILETFLTIERKRREDMLLMLLVILSAFIANYGFEYFFVLFAEERMMLTAGRATLYLAVYMFSYLIASFCFSCMRGKVSAETLSRISLGTAAIVMLGFFILCCVKDVKLQGILWVICILYGVCWGTFNIYIYPLWLTFLKDGNSGNLMGVYFVCTGLAMTIMPALYEVIRDASGTYVSIFAFCSVMFLSAWGILKIRRKVTWNN